LELTDATEALAWLEAERANLVAAVRQAATAPGVPSAAAVRLANALVGFFLQCGYWHDWQEVNQTALAVARQTGDRAGEAIVLCDLGGMLVRRGDQEQAVAHFEEVLAIYRELGDRAGHAATLTNLGDLRVRQGRHQGATTSRCRRRPC
jgi:tetratricopeptide (TPR) repeat protein